MLRAPKDVAEDVEYGSTFGGGEHPTPHEVADLIRARDREVIAEAKDVVRAFATVEQPTDKVLAALDAILKEKE